MYRVLSDLLDISGTATGRMAIEREPFRIGEIVRWLEPTLRSGARERGLGFEFLYRGSDAVVIGDRERIAQIVINLAGNAVKFTGTGTITVDLDYRDEVFHIIVSDTGPGVAPDRIEAIFEPFVQLDRTTSGNDDTVTPVGEGGLGLGLSIVRTLVDRLEGTITVHSAVGAGTTFHVTLPLAEAVGEPDGGDAPAASDAPAATTVAGAPTAPSDGPATPVAAGQINASDLVILVAEDEAINRLYLVRFLKQAGVTVVAAGDGVQAVEAVQHQRFHVILMDVSMPNMNGIEATKQIRRRENEHGFPPQPIIALTAHAQSEHARQCMDAGMNGYVSKPYREHQIWEGIARALGMEDPEMIRFS